MHTVCPCGRRTSATGAFAFAQFFGMERAAPPAPRGSLPRLWAPCCAATPLASLGVGATKPMERVYPRPKCGRSKVPLLLLLPHHTALVILVCVLRQRPLLFAPFFRPRRRSQTSPYGFVRSHTVWQHTLNTPPCRGRPPLSAKPKEIARDPRPHHGGSKPPPCTTYRRPGNNI